MDMSAVKKDINRLINRNQMFYKSRNVFRKVMQIDLAKLASEYGLAGEKDYPAPLGFIDVVWVTPNGGPVLAIEIDQDVESSIEKLNHLPERSSRLWLCYAAEERKTAYYESLYHGSMLEFELK